MRRKLREKRWNFLDIFLILMIQNFGFIVSDVFAQEKGTKVEHVVDKNLEISEESEKRHVIWLTPELSYRWFERRFFSLSARWTGVRW